jgi:hypothetical protein
MGCPDYSQGVRVEIEIFRTHNWVFTSSHVFVMIIDVLDRVNTEQKDSHIGTAKSLAKQLVFMKQLMRCIQG